MTIKYLSGFGNHFQTEAIANALPRKQNSPQKVPLGLYAEQLSGSAFTNQRAQNQKSWLYRIQPSVLHSGKYQPLEHPLLETITGNNSFPTPPTQMRWDSLPIPHQPCDFLQSLTTLLVNPGAGVHLYAANMSMEKKYFYNADGDFLIIPQQGELTLKTELGILQVAPGEIAVIQRGIVFQVCLKEANARGYICENYGPHFQLPERGVIGANGLTEERDFLTPTAYFEEEQGDFTLISKFQGQLWQTPITHSPLDVVAWHGNYAPYKYDLNQFKSVWSVSQDHSDPSIFTVLTSPSVYPGTANIDFVIFPERWMVAENTFRPPYYHRNIMSEYMGLIHGEYDAKPQGFVPGGGSLHNCMSPHGPDANAYEKAVSQELKPDYYQNTLAFMLESSAIWQTTDFALNGPIRQKNYLQCWQGLKSNFSKETV